MQLVNRSKWIIWFLLASTTAYSQSESPPAAGESKKRVVDQLKEKGISEKTIRSLVRSLLVRQNSLDTCDVDYSSHWYGSGTYTIVVRGNNSSSKRFDQEELDDLFNLLGDKLSTTQCITSDRQPPCSISSTKKGKIYLVKGNTRFSDNLSDTPQNTTLLESLILKFEENGVCQRTLVQKAFDALEHNPKALERLIEELGGIESFGGDLQLQ